MPNQKIPLTAIILTYNEEVNIQACLDSVCGLAEQIILVDSYSTDKTLEIAKNYTNVEVFQHPFINYSDQRNWAFNELPVQNDWILNLDADHRVTTELSAELKN